MVIVPNRLLQVLSGVILVFLCGCTTLHNYNHEQFGADIPLQPHDKITVILNDQNFTRYELFVVSVNPDSLQGKPVDDPEQTLQLRWDEISRIEARQFDRRKTAIWAVVIGLLLIAIVDTTGDVFEDLGDLFSSEE